MKDVSLENIMNMKVEDLQNLKDVYSSEKDDFLRGVMKWGNEDWADLNKRCNNVPDMLLGNLSAILYSTGDFSDDLYGIDDQLEYFKAYAEILDKACNDDRYLYYLENAVKQDLLDVTVESVIQGMPVEFSGNNEMAHFLAVPRALFKPFNNGDGINPALDFMLNCQQDYVWACANKESERADEYRKERNAGLALLVAVYFNENKKQFVDSIKDANDFGAAVHEVQDCVYNKFDKSGCKLNLYFPMAYEIVENPRNLAAEGSEIVSSDATVLDGGSEEVKRDLFSKVCSEVKDMLYADNVELVSPDDPMKVVDFDSPCEVAQLAENLKKNANKMTDLAEITYDSFKDSCEKYDLDFDMFVSDKDAAVNLLEVLEISSDFSPEDGMGLVDMALAEFAEQKASEKENDDGFER